MRQEKYKTRLAQEADLIKLLALHIEYFKQTKYWQEVGEDWSPQEAMDTLRYCLKDTQKAYTLVVERQDGAIVGMVVGFYCNTYWGIPDLSIEMAYISPLARDLFIRDLLTAALSFGIKNRRVMYARAAGESRIDGHSNKAYTNTLKRLGFEEMGANCIKHIAGRQDLWDLAHQKHRHPHPHQTTAQQ